MSRKVAVFWHALASIVAGALYFFFVLPRWSELTGETTHTLGTVMRIVAGALIGLAALPVAFTLIRTRKPELGTPQLALTLRTVSIALHVLAGVLIIGTAISEIWLSLDTLGPWLFGIYGAAAAIALLGFFAFHLAYLAEKPPPPPKPLKPKAEKRNRRRGRKEAEDTDDTDSEASDDSEADNTAADDEGDKSTTDDDAPAETEAPAEVTAEDDSSDEAVDAADGESAAEPAEATNGGLRNRRQGGRMTLRKRKRSGGGVAVDD
jgi:hypothetical protein